MAMHPLNADGGSAAVVRARVPDGDLARIIRLASRRRAKPGTVIRQLLQHALDQLDEQAAAGNGAGNE